MVGPWHLTTRILDPVSNASKGGDVQAVLDLPVDLDGSARLIFSLPVSQRERAYGRLRRLHLLKAMRNGFRSALAHHIADAGDARIRNLVLALRDAD